MGIDHYTAAFLAKALQQGVDFGRTLTIGRQQLLQSPRLLRTALRDGGISLDANQEMTLVEAGGGYSEPLFQHFGAHVVDSLDASDYEGATVTHDLNRPLPGKLRAKYSAVIDPGSLEHVFNFPMALSNCLECVTVGGHYLAVTPMNNNAGHGFYQFSPELYFRVLTKDNGFTIRCMLWRAQNPLARWYQVADPDALGRRVQRIGLGRAALYVVAQRTDMCDVLAEFPQQSDYVPLWTARSHETTAGAPAAANHASRHHTVARRTYERLPVGVRKTWRFVRWGEGDRSAMLWEANTFLRALYNGRTRGGAFKPIALRDLIFS